MLGPFKGSLSQNFCHIERAVATEDDHGRSGKKILSEPDFGLTSSQFFADLREFLSMRLGMSIATAGLTVNIRFISSLDAEDELRLATAMLAGFAKLLDELPIAYTIRLETAAGKVIEHHHVAGALPALDGSDVWQTPASIKSASDGSKVSRTHTKPDGIG